MLIMIDSNEIIKFVSPFVVPSIMIAVSLIVGGVCLVVSIKQIKQQIKLYNSITLVELKSPKMHYVIFATIVSLFIFIAIFMMLGDDSPEVLLMEKWLAMEHWQTNLMLGFLLVLLLCVDFMLIVLAKGRSAVVDRGIYIAQTYLDWYHVHDYIIDESAGIVILSAQKETFATLKGTTPPMRVSRNDIAKLKFILNKNKNKFSSF